MTYTKRIIVAGGCAALLHAALLLGMACFRTPPATVLAARPEPIVLNLNPQPPPQPKRFIETHTPADAPVEPTDLIAMHNSKARDLSDAVGTREAPHVEQIDDFDQESALPPAPEPLQPRPSVPAAPPVPAKEAPPLSEASSGDPVYVREPQAKSIAPAEPFEIAQAQPQPPPSDEPPATERGRVEGGVKRQGFAAFEAMEHELAPYLREVRRRVDRNWRAALQLRFSGTSPTRAVLDCAIRPDGRLAYVNIVEAGGSATFAPLCKQAVERAGPFPPFPFEVPDMYRDKNLEIRWTFRFLE
ncbi:MAG: hypothetical protein GWP08_16150 [Nitrospiraceae bacterium]|nr:hypothetical protein [Nitrospiraceae bacterium]